MPISTDKTYTIEQHIHVFSSWAAGRAASAKNSRFRVEDARKAIEHVCLDRLVCRPDRLPAGKYFDDAHAEWRSGVIRFMDACTGAKISHGSSAKLINVYLKGALVCAGHHEDSRVAHVHPPIDRLLLKKLGARDIGGFRKFWRDAALKGWSTWGAEQYDEVIRRIKSCVGSEPLWMIEKHWQGCV